MEARREESRRVPHGAPGDLRQEIDQTLLIFGRNGEDIDQCDRNIHQYTYSWRLEAICAITSRIFRCSSMKAFPDSMDPRISMPAKASLLNLVPSSL
jgi:hypothetical protein